MFIEERLLDRVTYGFVGGPTWSTTRVPLYSGLEARNAERTRPLYRYNAPYENIRQEHHDAVIGAYNTCLGGLHGFRFKDWADYTITGEILLVSDGSVDETAQLIKTYDFGGSATIRMIVKPVASTVLVYEDGVPMAYTLDSATGIITFTSTAGKVITATCEFDVPVMFESDELSFSFANYLSHSTDIGLKEDFTA